MLHIVALGLCLSDAVKDTTYGTTWAAADDGEGWGVDTTVRCRLHVLMMTMISARLLTLCAQVKIATFTSPEMQNKIWRSSSTQTNVHLS